MALFKEVKCTCCGKKTNVLTRTRLEDGQYLCSKCLEMIPYELSRELEGRSYADFETLKEYMEVNNPDWDKMFRETHKFHGIHIDTANALFYLDWLHPTTYFRFVDLDEFSLEFVPDEVKEGMFGTKVTGKIYMKIRVDSMLLYMDKVLAKDVKASAKISGVMNKKVTYENPKGMDEFLHHFLRAWDYAANIRKAADYYSNCYEQSSYEQPSYQNNELQQAMALFMIDDLNAITLADLKSQRNRLIKTFHPDHGSAADNGYAQKINIAYETLKACVS